MGADRSRDAYEAILVPARLEPWPEESDFAEADIGTGPVVPDDPESSVAIDAVGVPEDGRTLYLRTLHSGMPGVARAGFGWRDDPSDPWYGWDVPSSVRDTELVANHGTALGNDGFLRPHPVTLADGTLLVAHEDDLPAGLGGRVRIRYREWGATSWVSPSVLPTSDHVAEISPQLVVLPDGSAMCFYLVYRGTTWNIGYHFARDPKVGASWRRGSEAVVDAVMGVAGTVQPHRLRVRYNPANGQMMALVMTSTGLRQYASRDLGTSFTQVPHSMPAASNHKPELSVSLGSFVVGSVATVGHLHIRRLASAFTPLDTISDSDAIVGQLIMAGPERELALVSADDGSLYAYGTPGYAWGTSGDGGKTWAILLGDERRWLHFDGSVVNLQGTYRRGQVVLTCNQTGEPAANQGSLIAIYCGGYSTVTLPPEVVGHMTGRQSWWGQGWLAYHDYDDAPLLDDSLSTGSITVTRRAGGFYQIDTDASGDGVLRSLADDTDGEVTARIVMFGRCQLRLQWADGTDRTRVQVEIDDDTLRARDLVADAEIASVSVPAGAVVEVLASLRGNKSWAVYRVRALDAPGDLVTLYGPLTSLDDEASAQARQVQIRVPPSNTGYVRYMLWNFANWGNPGDHAASPIGPGLAEGQDTEDMFARPLPATGAAYVDDGVSVRGRSGPTHAGETFTMIPRAPRPATNLLPHLSPSPRQVFEAAAAPQSMVLAYRLAPNDSHVGQDSIGIFMGACLWSHFDVLLRVGGSWVTVASEVQRFIRTPFTRIGHTLIPATSGSGGPGPYLRRNELAGSYAMFDTGFTRRIAGNTEGTWTDGAVSQKRPVIRLEGLTGAEPSSGTCSLVAPDSLTVLHLAGDSTAEAIAIVVHPSADPALSTPPPGGRYRGGVLAIGPLAYLGRRVESQIGTRQETRVETLDLPDHVTRARVTAPPRRRVTIPLGTVDLTSARGETDPAYALATTTTNGEPVAHASDTPLLLEGLVDELGTRPVVWCPRIERGPPDVQTYLLDRAGGSVYGMLSWSGRRVSIGDPQRDELVDGGTLTIIEER